MLHTRLDKSPLCIELGLIVRLLMLWSWIRVKLIEMNLFDNAASRQNQYNLVTARIATRVYVLLLSFSMCVIVAYNALSVRTQNFIVQNPSQTIYENLQATYPMTIQCPCNGIIISYGTFMSLSPQYHPVCSSLLVSNGWISSVSAGQATITISDKDFRSFGMNFFAALAAICSLAQTNVVESWQSFNRTTLATSDVVSREEFVSRTHSSFSQFKIDTIFQFNLTFTFTQFLSQNMFLPKQNVDLAPANMVNGSARTEFFLWSENRNSCSCMMDSLCRESVGFPSYEDKQLVFSIPNVFRGCSIVQSVLISSLECFFNQSCLDAFQWQIISPQSVEVSILDANATHFEPQATIGELLRTLMIERWGESIQYDQYYEQCAPKLCSYSVRSKNSLLYVLVVAISLFGGLSITLKMITPPVVSFIRSRLTVQPPNNAQSGR